MKFKSLKRRRITTFTVMIVVVICAVAVYSVWGKQYMKADTNTSATASVSGVVMSDDGKPIQGAQVGLNLLHDKPLLAAGTTGRHEDYGASTDSTGHYLITNVPTSNIIESDHNSYPRRWDLNVNYSNNKCITSSYSIKNISVSGALTYDFTLKYTSPHVSGIVNIASDMGLATGVGVAYDLTAHDYHTGWFGLLYHITPQPDPSYNKTTFEDAKTHKFDFYCMQKGHDYVITLENGDESFLPDETIGNWRGGDDIFNVSDLGLPGTDTFLTFSKASEKIYYHY